MNTLEKNDISISSEQHIRENFISSLVIKLDNWDIQVRWNWEDRYYIAIEEHGFILLSKQNGKPESDIISVNKDHWTLKLKGNEEKYYDRETWITSTNKIRKLVRKWEMILYWEYIVNFDKEEKGFFEMNDEEIQQSINLWLRFTITISDRGDTWTITDSSISKRWEKYVIFITSDGIKFITKQWIPQNVIVVDTRRNICIIKYNWNSSRALMYNPETLEILDSLPWYELYDYDFYNLSSQVRLYFKWESRNHNGICLKYDFTSDSIERFWDYYLWEDDILYTQDKESQQFIPSAYIFKGKVVNFKGDIVDPSRVWKYNDMFTISWYQKLFDYSWEYVTEIGTSSLYTPNYKWELVEVHKDRVFEVEIVKGVFQEYRFKSGWTYSWGRWSDDYEVPDSLEVEDTYVKTWWKKISIHLHGKKIDARLDSTLIHQELHMSYNGIPVDIDNNGCIETIQYDSKNFLYNSHTNQWYYVDWEISIQIDDPELSTSLNKSITHEQVCKVLK